jgi:hypothetical protein
MLINESFHHNIAYVESEGESEPKFVQIDTWPGDGLAFHDNLYIAGNAIRPFDAIEATGTNLEMFDNVYYFAEEPLPFFWNEEEYASIEEWQEDTGLDESSEFIIGPLPPDVQQIRAALEALKSARSLRPEMFHSLHSFAEGQE